MSYKDWQATEMRLRPLREDRSVDWGKLGFAALVIAAFAFGYFYR